MTPPSGNSRRPNSRTDSILAVRSKYTFNRCRPLVGFGEMRREFDHPGDGSRPRVLDRQDGGGMPDFWVRTDPSPLMLVGVSNCSAHAMAVQERCDNPAVQEMTRTRSELLSWRPLSCGQLPIPIALEVEAAGVVGPAPPAVVVPHLVLDGPPFHSHILPESNGRAGRPTARCSIGGPSDSASTWALLKGKIQLRKVGKSLDLSPNGTRSAC